MPSFLSEDDIEREIIRVMKDLWEKNIRAYRRMGTLARLPLSFLLRKQGCLFRCISSRARVPKLRFFPSQPTVAKLLVWPSDAVKQ